MILYIYNVFFCGTVDYPMPYIISPLSDIKISLMIVQLEPQHFAVNTLRESVLCDCFNTYL